MTAPRAASCPLSQVCQPERPPRQFATGDTASSSSPWPCRPGPTEALWPHSSSLSSNHLVLHSELVSDTSPTSKQLLLFFVIETYSARGWQSDLFLPECLEPFASLGDERQQLAPAGAALGFCEDHQCGAERQGAGRGRESFRSACLLVPSGPHMEPWGKGEGLRNTLFGWKATDA